MNSVKKNNLISLYIVIISVIALATGFSDYIMANFFSDAYGVTALERGFIEIPRETPGIISVLVIASLARLGDIRITAISQFLCFIGIIVLGLSTPNLYFMMVFLFIFSLGQHIYLPLVDSIAVSIVSEEKVGTSLGLFKGISTVFALIASVIVYIGFKVDFFTFKTEFKSVFVISGILFLIATILLFILASRAKRQNRVPETPKLIFRKEYKYYYILSVMSGVQKQIVLVYAPWVIIEILGRGADITAILLIISSICGIFFMPFLGRCIDRFGIRKMLYADALSFIGVYLLFAFIVYNLYVGNFSKTGIAAIMTFIVFIFDRMSSQMTIIRTVYLKNISIDKTDLLPTLSFGMTLEHIIAIGCSFLSGVIWTKFGPHFIFILVASLSLVNLFVAKLVKIKE